MSENYPSRSELAIFGSEDQRLIHRAIVTESKRKSTTFCAIFSREICFALQSFRCGALARLPREHTGSEGVHGVVVSHPLSLQRAPGANPCVHVHSQRQVRGAASPLCLLVASEPGTNVAAKSCFPHELKERHLWDSNPRGETPSA